MAAYGVSQCVRYMYCTWYIIHVCVSLGLRILFVVCGKSSGSNQNASHGGLILKELSVRVERLSTKDTIRYAKAAAF